MEFVSMYLLDALVGTMAYTLDHVFQELQKVYGVGDELVKLQNSVSQIQGVLNDAQESEETRNSVKQLLNELRKVLYRANDVLDEVATEMQRQQLIKYAAVRNSLGPVNPKRLLFQRDVYKKIQSIEEELDEIAKRCPLIALTPRNGSERTHISESTSVSPPCVLGRERDQQRIKQLLMPLRRTDSAASVISIFGKPGVGKTTLAQELLVLDDVWQESQEWERLKSSMYSAGEGSKILVTTRSEQVAFFMAAANSPPYELEGLSMEDCWFLIRQPALSRNPSASFTLDFYKSHAVDKCRGLPMAAKALGQRLASEADRGKWGTILTGQSWEFSGSSSSIMEPLILSYQHLPRYLKPCFAYLSIIPKGCELERDFIIQLWMAQSFIRQRGTEKMEDAGSDYLDSLIRSSFLQYSHFGHESR